VGRRTALALLLLICGAALGLRIWGIRWGVPQAPYWDAYHPDERVGFRVAYRISYEQQDLNPHYFINPSWHYYTLALACRVGSWLKLVPSIAQIGEGQARLEDITDIWVLGRMISVLLGTLAVVLIYLAALRATGSRVWGLAAAGMTACSPVLAVQSHFITVDGPAVFWLLLAFVLLQSAFDKPGIGRALLAGAAGGLAAATKYSAVAIALPAMVAFGHLIARSGGARAAGLKSAAAYAAGMAGGFVLGCPYSVLAWGEFRAGLAQMAGYTDFVTDFAYPWLTGLRLALGWPLWLMFLASLAVSLIKPTIREAMALSLVGGFGLVLGYKASPYYRHLLLALPFAFLMMASAAARLAGWLAGTRWRPLLIAWSACLALGTAYALANSVGWVGLMAGRDTRDEAADYIRRQYPEGSAIAVPSIYDFYCPDLQGYRVLRLQYDPGRLEQNMPRTIVATDYEREGLIFCKGSPDDARRLFDRIERAYVPVKTFKHAPRCCGLTFTGYPVTDWRYAYPQITIYEKSCR